MLHFIINRKCEQSGFGFPGKLGENSKLDSEHQPKEEYGAYCKEEAKRN
jgi:hypothetical protein